MEEPPAQSVCDEPVTTQKVVDEESSLTQPVAVPEVAPPDASAPKVDASASAPETVNIKHETETPNVVDSAKDSVLDPPKKDEAVIVKPEPAVDLRPKRKRRRANNPLHGWPPTLERPLYFLKNKFGLLIGFSCECVSTVNRGQSYIKCECGKIWTRPLKDHHALQHANLSKQHRSPQYFPQQLMARGNAQPANKSSRQRSDSESSSYEWQVRHTPVGEEYQVSVPPFDGGLTQKADTTSGSFWPLPRDRPTGLDNEELDKVLSSTCVLHPVKVPTIGMSSERPIPCRRCGVVMRLPGSAYRGFCCGIAYEACQKRQQELSKTAASPQLRKLRLREGRHAEHGGEGGMQPVLVANTLRVLASCGYQLELAKSQAEQLRKCKLIQETKLWTAANKAMFERQIFYHGRDFRKVHQGMCQALKNQQRIKSISSSQNQLEEEESDQTSPPGTENTSPSTPTSERKSVTRMNRVRSSYRGVNWLPKARMWRAIIYVDGRQKYLGTFKNELDAAMAYDRAAQQYDKPAHSFNFSSDIFSPANGADADGVADATPTTDAVSTPHSLTARAETEDDTAPNVMIATNTATPVRVPTTPVVASESKIVPEVIVVGSRVEALWDEQTEYYQGVVESLNEDGTYNILYDDGDREHNVKPQHARLSHLTFGTRVKANLREQGEFLSGIVDAVNGDGTYSICFDNGEKEEHVSRAMIQTTIEDSLWSREWSVESFPNLKDVVAYYYRRFKHSESYAKWKIHWSTVQAEKDERDAHNMDTCWVCGTRGMLLLCDNRDCGRSWHRECLDPPMTEVPEGEWHCPVCANGFGAVKKCAPVESSPSREESQQLPILPKASRAPHIKVKKCPYCHREFNAKSVAQHRRRCAKKLGIAIPVGNSKACPGCHEYFDIKTIRQHMRTCKAALSLCSDDDTDASEAPSARKSVARKLLMDTETDSSRKRRHATCSVIGCNKRRRVGGRCVAHGGGKRCEVDGCERAIQAPGNRCIMHGGGHRCKLYGCFKRAQRGKPRCLGHMRDPSATICQFDICPVVLESVDSDQERSLSDLLCESHKNEIEALVMARSVCRLKEGNLLDDTDSLKGAPQEGADRAKKTPLIIKDVLERLEAKLLCPVPKSMPHNGTSSFKGVTKLGNSYQATLGLRKTNVYLGRYASEYQAGTAYVVAAYVRSCLIPHFKPDPVPKQVLKELCMQTLERIPSLEKPNLIEDKPTEATL